MKEHDYTSVYPRIPDNSASVGGQSVQAQVRSQFVNGRYDDATWDPLIWTADTYFPGAQDDYWQGEKLIYKQNARNRLLFRKQHNSH